jgi:hypothetical protein
MAEVKTKILNQSMESYFQMGFSWHRAQDCVLFCSAGCGEERCGGEGPTGSELAMKHVGLHGKYFVLLLVVLVSTVLQHLVSVTPNKSMFCIKS